jgi:hypothetical protein
MYLPKKVQYKWIATLCYLASTCFVLNSQSPLLVVSQQRTQIRVSLLVRKKVGYVLYEKVTVRLHTSEWHWNLRDAFSIIRYPTVLKLNRLILFKRFFFFVYRDQVFTFWWGGSMSVSPSRGWQDLWCCFRIPLIFPGGSWSVRFLLRIIWPLLLLQESSRLCERIMVDGFIPMFIDFCPLLQDSTYIGGGSSSMGSPREW